MNPVIETVTGKFVDVMTPKHSTIDIQDIAWALSRISRFAGHTVTEKPYTVAQHCVFVADMILKETKDYNLALYGLLHDAAEAYIGDIPSPVKHIDGLRESINKIEDRLMNIITQKYAGNLPELDQVRVVKYYDKKAQHIEAHAFMSSRGKGWVDHDSYEISLVELQHFPAPKSSLEVYEEFINTYKMLRDGIE